MQICGVQYCLFSGVVRIRSLDLLLTLSTTHLPFCTAASHVHYLFSIGLDTPFFALQLHMYRCGLGSDGGSPHGSGKFVVGKFVLVGKFVVTPTMAPTKWHGLPGKDTGSYVGGTVF